MEQTKAIFLDEVEEDLKQQILDLVEHYLYSEFKISDTDIAKKIFSLVRSTYDI